MSCIWPGVLPCISTEANRAAGGFAVERHPVQQQAQTEKATNATTCHSQATWPAPKMSPFLLSLCIFYQPIRLLSGFSHCRAGRTLFKLCDLEAKRGWVFAKTDVAAPKALPEGTPKCAFLINVEAGASSSAQPFGASLPAH